jgi:hypothetical protein
MSAALQQLLALLHQHPHKVLIPVLQLGTCRGCLGQVKRCAVWQPKWGCLNCSAEKILIPELQFTQCPHVWCQ